MASGLAGIDFVLPRQPVKRAKQIGFPFDAAFFHRPAQRHAFDFDAGAHQIAAGFRCDTSETRKPLFCSSSTRPSASSRIKRLADGTDAHAVALAQCLDAQPFVRHQAAGDDVGAELASMPTHSMSGRSGSREHRMALVLRQAAPRARLSVSPYTRDFHIINGFSKIC